MCNRRLVMGLLGVSVVAVLVALDTEANAGTCTKPPCAGVKWYAGSCICCTTGGSEVFNFTALGVPGHFVNNCPEGENCLQCSVYGTAGDPSICDPTTLDEDCDIEGVLFCVNHGGNAATAQGQPFTMDAALNASGNFSNCNRAGKCTGSITVPGDLPEDGCINPNWEPLGFTASRFNGECCSCDVGYDDNGDCTGGTETCTVEGFRCSVNPVPRLGISQPYQCCLLSELDPETGECPQP